VRKVYRFLLLPFAGTVRTRCEQKISEMTKRAKNVAFFDAAVLDQARMCRRFEQRESVEATAFSHSGLRLCGW